jgi:FlaA1/EpsC-like NDP-sugar epimerase
MNQLTQIREARRIPGLRLAGTAWRAFGPAAAAAELILIVAASIGCGVAWHLTVHDATGDLVAFAALGAVVALIFISTNAFMGDYALPLYISATSRIRRPLAAWNVAFLYTLAMSFIAKSAADLSRGNVILLYATGAAAVILWRWLLIRLVAEASRTGRVAARRVLLVGEREAIQAFARRYRPWSLGFEIVGQAVLHSGDSLDRDLERAALVGRALHPDDVFMIMPWSNTETIERAVDRLMTLPVSIHLGPERILDRFAKVEIIKVADMATLCLARPPLTFLEVIAKRVLDIVAAAIGLVLLLPLFALVTLLIRLDGPGPVLFRQQR